MLKKLFKSQPKVVEIFSPLKGEVIDITEVPDPAFSGKMLGDGFAIIPSEGRLLSPVEGKVIELFPTKHAIGIETAQGLELLIHVGLETVELDGEGFEVIVNTGDSVKAGDHLLNFDIEFLEKNNKEITTPVVITNHQDKVKEFSKVANSEVNYQDLVLKCELM